MNNIYVTLHQINFKYYRYNEPGCNLVCDSDIMPVLTPVNNTYGTPLQDGKKQHIFMSIITLSFLCQ